MAIQYQIQLTRYLPDDIRRCLKGAIQLDNSILPLKNRNLIGQLLEHEKLKSGIELGVQTGVFAKQTLQSWPSCEQYILVDLWKKQTNYIDGANVENDKQEENYNHTINILQPWKDKVRVMRMLTSEAAAILVNKNIKVDYIYVDARHDYCGVKEDIDLYWPLIRSGGIMAGHDYLEAFEVEGQDWSVCADGRKEPGAVKGAVNEFVTKNGLNLQVTYGDQPWNSWIVRKP